MGTFDKGSAEQWTPLYGNWWVKEGVYQQDDDRLENTKTMLSLPDSDCYTLEVKVSTPGYTAGSATAIVKFQNKYVAWELGAGSNTSSSVSGIDKPEETNRSCHLKEKTWYRAKVIVNGERLVGWLDDEQKWSIRRSAAEVKGLDPAGLGKDLVGLVGLGTNRAHYQFSGVQVTPECK
jgi:hypothetical protein